MNGARSLALDYILPRIVPGQSVLDLGAGGSPLAGMMQKRGCHVTAVDHDRAALTQAWEESGRDYHIAVADLTKSFFFNDDRFDLVVAVYAIQHMLGHQAYVWSQVARALKPGGRFIFVGRYDAEAPRIEIRPVDHLLSDNRQTIAHSALMCGLDLTEFEYCGYDGFGYRKTCGGTDTNALIADMVKP